MNITITGEKTGRKCESCADYVYRENYDSGGACKPKGTV